MGKTRELCSEAILGRYLYIVPFRCSLDWNNISETFKVKTWRCVFFCSVFVLFLFLFLFLFFFSAINAKGLPKSKGKKQASAPIPNGDGSNNEVLTSQVANNTSPVWLSHHATVVDEKLRPTINY